MSSRTSFVNYYESEDDELMYNDRKPSAMSTPPPKKPRRVTLSPGNEGDDEVRTVLYWFAFFCSSSFLQNYSKILSFLPIMFSFVLFVTEEAGCES
jgi:hypothetical protein